MLKTCSRCRVEYFARWRNEPVTMCPRCWQAAGAGAHLAALYVPYDLSDPDQFELFRERVRRPQLEPLDDDARYWSLRRKATQAERRRYPFH